MSRARDPGHQLLGWGNAKSGIPLASLASESMERRMRENGHMDEQQPADKISAAAAVLRRLMAAVDAGEIEATTSQARAMLRRIEGAALALESLSES